MTKQLKIIPLVAPIPDLKTFTFAPGMNLRVIDKDGNPWFAAIDVCTALGLNADKRGTSHFIKGLDADEVNTAPIREGIRRGNPHVKIINESGLYSMILKSRKPEAKVFKKWVTSEVLPSIRKHGVYLAPVVAAEVVESPEAFMARAVLAADEMIRKLKVRTKGLEGESLQVRGKLRTNAKAASTFIVA